MPESTVNTFKPLGPAPIQDPFQIKLNQANPWGSGKVTGAISTLELIQNPDTKDGTLYAGSVSGGVWARKYNGATDSWDEEWKWLSSSIDYKGVQSISKLKVTADKKLLIAASGAVSSFGDLRGDIKEPLQLASLAPDGTFKQWKQNVENNQDLIKGKAVTALETSNNLVIIGTDEGLYVGKIDGELKKVTASPNIPYNIHSIVVGESGRIYAATLAGIFTITSSALAEDQESYWQLVSNSTSLTQKKQALRLATQKDPASGKDILYLGSGVENQYSTISRVIYNNEETLDWVNLNTANQIATEISFGSHMTLKAHPTELNRVLAGGTYLKGNIIGQGAAGGLTEVTFVEKEGKYEPHARTTNFPKNADGTAPHADSRDIIFLTTKGNTTRIIEASDGGIAIKDINIMAPWKFNLNEGGLRTTESFSSDWSNVGNLAITAMQDNAVSITKYNSTPTWLNITGGDGAIARFDDAKKDNRNGLSYAYYGSQSYSNGGILETAAYDKSGTLTRTDRLELEVLDSFENFQDFLNYDMIYTKYDPKTQNGYDFYLPFETNAYRANDIVLAGQRNLYEQIVPHWQLPTYGEMMLVPLLEDIDTKKAARRRFTAVEIGSRKGETLSKSKPYSWDSLYTSFYEMDQTNTRSSTSYLYGRKADEEKKESRGTKDIASNFRLTDLSSYLPPEAKKGVITGISVNPNNSDELWATISNGSINYYGAPKDSKDFQKPSHLIYSSNGGKNWVFQIGSGQGQNGIPENAQLQQVQYVPARDGKSAELYLGGYGGVWQATINNDGKPGAFKSVNWDGLGEKPNFNLWNTNLEYDPVDDVLIASIMGQGAWLLNRSPLEAAPAATPGLRISPIVLPQTNIFLKRKKDRAINGVMTVSLERTEENKNSNVSVDLSLDPGWEKYLSLTRINQPNSDDLEGKNSITLNFPKDVNQLSFYVQTVLPYITLPDIKIGVSLKNPVNSIIATDNPSSFAYLYANGETIMLREEAEGVFSSDSTRLERFTKERFPNFPSQAQQLAVLMPRANLNTGDQLFWFTVNSDGSINDGTKKIMPTEVNYIEAVKKQFNTYQLIGTSTQVYDDRAFSPEKAALAFSNPNVVLSSEGVSIGDLSSTAGSTLPSQEKFALALQDSKGNVRVSTQGSELDSNPALDNTLIIGKPGIGSQVVLAPAQGELFVADINFSSSDIVPADRIEYNLDVASFGNYTSGYGIFRVDDPYGNFRVINNVINNTEKPAVEIGSLDYATEALKRSLSNGLDGITGMPPPGFAQSKKESIILATGNYYGLYITPNQIIKSTDQLTDLSQILFSIKDANQNKELQHVSMGTGYFAFEDMGFAGDRDFNDMLFAITPKNPSII